MSEKKRLSVLICRTRLIQYTHRFVECTSVHLLKYCSLVELEVLSISILCNFIRVLL